MTSPSFSIAFHIGAHKTATSHLQRCLSKASEELAAEGVRYYGPQYFRQRRHAIHGLFGLRTGTNPKVARRSPTDQLAIIRKDGHRLVLSEENFIGPLNDPQGQPVAKRYEKAGAHLTSLAHAIDHDLDIFVSVRRPTAYLNSAYCQMLLGGLILPFDVYKAHNPLSSIDWFELIGQLRAVKGVGQVVVWRYEDYTQVYPKIIAGLVGQAQLPHIPWVKRTINEGLSAAAVAQVLADSADEDAAQLGYTARGALPVGADYPAFDGYTAAEHAAGDEVYLAQLAAIAALEGVTILRPDPA